MPSENAKMLEFNKYQKSDKVSFIIYVDLECLMEKIDGLQNNSEHSSTTHSLNPRFYKGGMDFLKIGHKGGFIFFNKGRERKKGRDSV